MQKSKALKGIIGADSKMSIVNQREFWSIQHNYDPLWHNKMNADLHFNKQSEIKGSIN